MIVIRRTYQCKTGHAGPAAELYREVARIICERDPHAAAVRIYTDLSGRTDRVVVETERDCFQSPREISALVHGHPDAPALFGRLMEHIIASDVEFLQLEHTLP